MELSDHEEFSLKRNGAPTYSEPTFAIEPDDRLILRVKAHLLIPILSIFSIVRVEKMALSQDLVVGEIIKLYCR